MKFEIKSRWDSNQVLFQTEAESFAACVNAAIKASADLQSADLQSADLRGADLQSANLQSADLQSADLRSADLQSANLRGAYLYGANLRGANLYGADLQSADLPAPTMVLLATWGELSPKLTTELMKYDAFFHPNPKAFAEWAKDGSCPYSNVKVQRAANFLENKKLWKKGTPKSGYALMVAVLREKTKTDL